MSKTKKSIKKTHNRKHSFIISFFMVTICISLAISLISLSKNIAETKKEISNLETQCENQQAENAEMQNMIDEDDIDAYVESVARNKLGYVKPGEKVYCDESVGQ